jgi:hypothetical protein
MAKVLASRLEIFRFLVDLLAGLDQGIPEALGLKYGRPDIAFAINSFPLEVLKSP